jgi:hypothetical protein
VVLDLANMKEVAKIAPEKTPRGLDRQSSSCSQCSRHDRCFRWMPITAGRATSVGSLAMFPGH